MAGRRALAIIATLAAALLTAGLLASPEAGEPEVVPTASPTGGTSTGADVTVIYLPGVSYHGQVAGVHSYSVGTTSCNVGNEPLWWCNDVGDPFCETDQHPVIAQNLYRLKDGRFEQLGMSWLKHGFFSLNTPDPACGDCIFPPHGGDQLGVGCTDAYSSGLNGSRPLGLRSEVNAATGAFPYPYTEIPHSGSIDQRIQVEATELDPILNPGARYWIEGQYVAADDAAEGNANNNASYREVDVESDFDLSPTGPTVREVPAIYAWQAIDPEVEIVAVDTPDGERFHAGRRITEDGGVMHHEYAIHNLSSDRSARSFTIRLPASADIRNAGFRDVDHHSGEPYATTDWTIDVDGGTVTWFTDDFATDPDANALRWGTMFSFWLDVDVAGNTTYSLGLFKPGAPQDVEIPFTPILGDLIFADGFESGDLSAWSCAGPPGCK